MISDRVFYAVFNVFTLHAIFTQLDKISLFYFFFFNFFIDSQSPSSKTTMFEVEVIQDFSCRSRINAYESPEICLFLRS